MAVVALGSIRSSGTTTLAVGLAATWPKDRRALLVEADPAGGTLAGACGWPPSPSLVSLAAAARRHADPEAIWAHCHELPGGAPVLAAPAGADQARSAAGILGALLGRLDELDADVLVDLGRLDPAVPMPEMVERAAPVVLTTRPALADLHSLATYLEARVGADLSLRERLGLVLVGDGPYPDTEIAGAFGVEVLGHLPWDPETAGLITVLPASDRRLRLSPLVRAARSLAEALAGDLAPVAETLPVNMPAPSALTRRRDVDGHSASAGNRVRSRLRRPFRTPAGTSVGTTATAMGTGSSAGEDGAGENGAGGSRFVESRTAGNGVAANGSRPGGEQVR